MPHTDMMIVRHRQRPNGLVARARDAVRAYWSSPKNLKDPALAKWWDTGSGSGLSGVAVTEQTAMGIAAVWSAVTIISDDIASLPLHLYKRIKGGGKERFDAHPLYYLLHDAPNPEMDSVIWRATMQTHVLLWGNAYAEIERNNAGMPVAIWPILPESVTPERGPGGLRYRVANPSGGHVYLPARDMLHLVGHTHDGSVGASLVQSAKDSLALGLAAQRFGESFFGNGAMVGGVISFKGARPPELSDKGFREQFAHRHQGVERAHKLLALYNDASFTPMNVAPNAAQFLETRVFQIREVARWFKLPPPVLGDNSDATYNNLEQMGADYLSRCIRPWLKKWEQQLQRKLIADTEYKQQLIEHDTHGFLSIDAASRASLASTEIRIAAVTPNEIRSYENRNPVEGGDEAQITLDVLPLSLQGRKWLADIRKTEVEIAKLEAEIEAAKHPPVTPPPDDADRAALRAAVVALTAAREQEATEKRQAWQKADDLSAALAQETAAKDQALADLVHVRELLAGAEQALGQEQTEHGLTRGQLTAAEAAIVARDEAQRRAVEEWDAKAAEMETRLAETIAHWTAAVARVDAELVAVRDAYTQEQQATATLTAERDTIQGARDALQTRLDAAVSAHGATAALLATVDTAREAATADAAARTAERDALRAERDEAGAHRLAALAEAAAANAAAAEAAAGQLAAEQRAEAADRDKAIAEQAQRAANETIAALQAEMAESRQTQAARVAGILVAHRGLVVDVMRRMVEREIDRAKRHQTTPQKFRAWLDTFYQTHTDAVAEALLPAVRAHLAILSSACDPHEMARQLAEDHVAASEKQLRDLLHVEDFPVMLERTLAVWETARPEQVADRLLTKGLADVR